MFLMITERIETERVGTYEVMAYIFSDVDCLPRESRAFCDLRFG